MGGYEEGGVAMKEDGKLIRVYGWLRRGCEAKKRRGMAKKGDVWLRRATSG